MGTSCVFTYGHKVQKCLPHHISVERLLTGIQQSPLSRGEFHSHILEGHRLLKQSIYYMVTCNCGLTLYRITEHCGF